MAAVAGALAAKLNKFSSENPATYFIGRRHAQHAWAMAAKAGALGLAGGLGCTRGWAGGNAAEGEEGQAEGGGGARRRWGEVAAGRLLQRFRHVHPGFFGSAARMWRAAVEIERQVVAVVDEAVRPPQMVSGGPQGSRRSYSAPCA